MTRRRLLLYSLPILVGAAGAAAWVAATGGETLLNGLRRASPRALASMIGVTLWWLGVRFVRWQFLLRRAETRVPIRESFVIYVAGLPGTATPGYVGELLRGVLLRRTFGVPVRTSSTVWLLERCWDLVTIAGLAAVVARTWQGLLLAAGFAGLGVAIALGVRSVARRLGAPARAIQRLQAPRTLVLAAGLSVAAWLPAALLPLMASATIGQPIGTVNSVAVFSNSTLLGAITLSPAGFGVTGSAMIVELRRLAMSLPDAVTVVSLVRAASTGFALALGLGFLLWALRRRETIDGGIAHFDEIAAVYDAQFSAHVWDLLLERKLGRMQRQLPSPPASSGIGLDLGCGLGRQTAEMRRRGYRVIGVDPAHQLLAHGASPDSMYAAASALALPFKESAFDFVYVIGVLHHLPGREAQREAFAEIRRVLKPGGLLMIHETNPRNPIFRFYMGYVFPMLKRIDEGTEWWIEPDLLPSTSGFSVKDIDYFTFLPDFIPRPMLPVALRVEQALERSRLRRYSVHFFAVLRRDTA